MAFLGLSDQQAILDEELWGTVSAPRPAQRGLANRSQSRGNVEFGAEPLLGCFVWNQ